jgi:hypothetical protein
MSSITLIELIQNSLSNKNIDLTNIDYSNKKINKIGIIEPSIAQKIIVLNLSNNLLKNLEGI